MLSSLTLNVVTSPLTSLENAFKRWELSSLSDEKITRMEEFISIASLTLGGKEGSDELLASMLKVVTPILNSLKEHQKRATTTRLKMEMSCSKAWTDPYRAEAEIARLLLNGLKLRQQAIESRFGIWYMNWIQKVRQLISPHFKSTVTGSSHLSLPSMSPLETLSSMEEMLMEEIAGYYSLASDLENHV